MFDDAPLRAVQFVDANEGWAVGDDGIILHTIDGGKTWDRQKSGTRASLRSVQFLTPYTGWVAGRIDKPTGSVGVLLHTTDGGLTWTEIGAGLLPGLNVVRFFDDKHGFVAGAATDTDLCGVYLTKDAGASWAPLNGPPCPTWLAADMAEPSTGLMGGMWGRLAMWSDGQLEAKSADLPGGRAVQAVRLAGPRGVMVGDGGMVQTTANIAAAAWRIADLPLAPAARAVCDFRCVAVHGECIWIAGRPGSFVLFSPDFGTSWEIRPTGVTVPLNGLCMISDTVGWAVGEFGTILSTTDGGKTWTLRRSGGQRAAVLFAHGSAASVPLAVLPTLGAAEGYLAAVLTLTSPDPITASPERASQEFRLAAAVRLAGGAAAEAVWGFPLPAHCHGLTAEQLLAFWDRHQGGKSREHLLRQLVLAVRMWRPDVIVTDVIDPDASAAERILLFAAKEAFRLAADPAAFPEQLEHLGLKPHAPKKLYARTPDLTAAPVLFDVTTFRADLADSPALAAEPGLQLLGGTRLADPLAFRLVSHRLDGAETHTAFTDGCSLARGGTARRRSEPPQYSPQYLAMRESVAQARRQLAEWLDPAEVEKNGEAVFANVAEHLKAIPDDAAAEAIVAAANECAAAGRWTTARELYLLAANRYPTQPATAAAYSWLVRYHASGEALRRIELGQQPPLRTAMFAPAPEPQTDAIVQASFIEPAGPRLRFRSAEAERDWMGTGVGLEPRLFIVEPTAFRSVTTQLSVHASRRRLGLSADATQNLIAYRRATFAANADPSANPWLAAVVSELWLANRGQAAAPPKPLSVCCKTEQKPHLDGTLDDACWQDATPLSVAVGPAELAADYPTEARFAYDDEFLYIAVSCRHPAAEPAQKATKRRRDEDLRAHDRIELLLDLDRDYRTYYRLRIDHRGCVAEDCCGDPSWDPRWFVAAEPTATGWTAEAAIPLAELTSRPPRPGHVWAVNVVRVLPGRGVLGWSGPADADPRPEGMGLIEFQAK
jgi:photosystem II stability/assembly factor-like uncharacterized protein